MNRRILYTSGDSALSLQKKLKKKHTYSSNSAVQDMNNRKDFYSLFTSAVRQVFSHTGGYDICSQTVYHNIPTASCSNYKMCSFSEFCHKFHLTFPSVYGRKAEPRTLDEPLLIEQIECL
jgi:hypothetical protein